MSGAAEERNAKWSMLPLASERSVCTTIHPQDGAEVVNMVLDRVRAELLRRIGLTDVLTPRDLTGPSKSAA